MTDRRNVLRLAGAAILLPLAATAAGQPRFAPPDGPMLYSRRIERDLADGAAFVVTRRFAVRFRPREDGFLVEGEQVDVEVEAPEALAAFARIERERTERGLFPLRLDPEGRIAGAVAEAEGSDLDEAVREVLARIDDLPREQGERAELLRFVAAIHEGAGRTLTELPPDLFAPDPSPRTETREVPLPNGGKGAVTVTFAASADPATGLLREATREVLTQLEGSRRRTLESWRLEPLS